MYHVDGFFILTSKGEMNMNKDERNLVKGIGLLISGLSIIMYIWGGTFSHTEAGMGLFAGLTLFLVAKKMR